LLLKMREQKVEHPITFEAPGFSAHELVPRQHSTSALRFAGILGAAADRLAHVGDYAAYPDGTISTLARTGVVP
jgi:hypothetical protein